MFRSYLLGALLVCSLPSFAQEQDTTDLQLLSNLSAETEATELQRKLNEKVGAASKKALSSRETPGIVSIITEEEIRKSGARDMIDLLRSIPGFDFGQDLDFVSGLILRGAWSFEGKILVLLDGMELNDLLYQNVAFFNRFPVDLIERIELIRGPGSAIYGGTAEFGVINIITKGSIGTQSGLEAFLMTGFLPDAIGRTNAGISFVKRFDAKTHVDVSYFQGKSIRSDQTYQDFEKAEPEVNLTNQSDVTTRNLNVGFTTGTLSVRGLFENYLLNRPGLSTEFKNSFFALKKDFNLKNGKITPYLQYTSQRPWQQKEPDGKYLINRLASRLKGGVTTSIDVTRKLNFVAGVEAFQDQASSDSSTYFRGKDNISFNLFSVYAQLLYQNRIANITAGFRADKHNAFGAAFVPRIALTKRFDYLHFKILASGSYRAPGIINMTVNSAIKPERSVVFESEIGYQLTPDMILSVNGYSIRTKDIIVYFYEDLGNNEYIEGYENERRFGTSGIEMHYTFKNKKWNFEANLSYYNAGKSDVASYSIPGEENKFIAAGTWKTVLTGGVNLTPTLSFHTTFNLFSSRMAYTEPGVITKLEPYNLINLYLLYENAFVKGLNLSAGVFDLLNERPVLPQAYDGGFSAISGRSREVTAKISYKLPFDKK